MKIDQEPFGKTATGKDISLFRVTNSIGAFIEIIEFGAIIKQLAVPDRNGKIENVVYTQTELSGYEGYGQHAAVIGRIANRVKGAEFTVEGRTFKLEPGMDGITLHSGSGDYSHRVFSGEAIARDGCGEVTLYLNDRGEAGFETELDVWVTYSFTEDNELSITYKTQPKESTVVNITNHAYFNIGGIGSGSVAEQIMQISADFTTPFITMNDASGAVVPVKGTPYDYNDEAQVGERYSDTFWGFDVNYVPRGTGFRYMASIRDDKSGRKMEVYSDMPGLQIYTGFARPPEFTCFETQFFPDSANVPHYPSPVQLAGSTYISKTSYKLSVY